MEADLTVDVLARTAAEVEGRLKDRLEAAVVLETLGFKDEDARRLGYADLFRLADAVRRVVPAYAWEEPWREQPRRRDSGFRLYLAGTFYNISWVIMLVALFLGGQSLWAARDLPVAVSTAIGLGVVLGLVCTGGLQQFAAWKLVYYRLQENDPLARFVMRRTLVFGVPLLVVLAVLLAAVEVAWIGLPAEAAGLSAAYFLLLGGFRLAVTPVFAFRKFAALVVLSLAALGAMVGAYQVLAGLGTDRVTAVVASQLLGLSLLAAGSAIALRAFVFRERPEERRPGDPPFYARRELPRNVTPPKFWTLAYQGAPYLAYGTLYFAFLFGDRLVSWFTAGPAPFAVAYNTAYHIGVDLALLLLVPITAVKYPVLYRLSEQLESAARGASASAPTAFRRSVGRFHTHLTARVLAVAVLGALLAAALAEGIVGLAGGGPESVGVFRTALAGVVLFALFLSNAVFAMAFRRTGAMAGLLAVGTGMNFAVAYAFASSFGAASAVVGFLLSAMFLAVASSVYVLQLRRSAEHAYFAAG